MVPIFLMVGVFCSTLAFLYWGQWLVMSLFLMAAVTAGVVVSDLYDKKDKED